MADHGGQRSSYEIRYEAGEYRSDGDHTVVELTINGSKRHVGIPAPLRAEISLSAVFPATHMAPLSPSSPLDVRDAKPRLRVEIEGFQERRRAAWLVFGAIDAGVRETEGELALPWTLRGCRSLLLAVNYTRPTITAGTSAIGVK